MKKSISHLPSAVANFESAMHNVRLRWRRHWWGTWVIDWFTCGRDEEDFTTTAWLSFDIWAKAYREINPELDEHNVSDFELIEDHYDAGMDVLFSSWIFFVWRLLQWPMNCVHQFVWQIKVKLFCEF